ncbi:carbohydrate kinase family protein [Pseudomonas massiliensis]|uniref:carbohydrate kinase family protein n=1 Tax=Pseudomonas massiliensis TaxID=522492 RepID=UPI00058EFDB4|nr:carbohydrate kinase [Pseudomonas massiliensis]
MFLVCGEALYDFFCDTRLGEPQSRLAYTAVAGGSPFNVAVGLARLQAPVGLLAGLSTDALGENLVALLAREGVAGDYLQRFEAPTTLAMVSLSGAGIPSYAFRGAGCADRALEPRHLPELDARVTALHFGSFSLVVEPVGSTLRSLARRERGRRLISYDPNVRLNPAPDIHQWRASVAEMVGMAHLVKVSDEDLALLYPQVSIEQVANGWLEQGCELVFVTRGGEGAEAYSCGQACVRVAAPVVQVRDTVGAGDTFQAALLTWLHERSKAVPDQLRSLNAQDLEAMLHFACKAAAVTCSRIGPDLPRRSELQA